MDKSSAAREQCRCAAALTRAPRTSFHRDRFDTYTYHHKTSTRRHLLRGLYELFLGLLLILELVDDFDEANIQEYHSRL